MSDNWIYELAAAGDGHWFVSARYADVRVIAPPGVPVSNREPRIPEGQPPSGWHIAIWPSTPFRDLCIDTDQPASVQRISTKEAMRLLGPTWREEVWRLMSSQLRDAQVFGQPSAGEATEEDLARSGARAAAFLQRELTEAFPESIGAVTSSSVVWPLDTWPEMPGNVEDFLDLTQPSSDDQGGRTEMPAVGRLVGKLLSSVSPAETWLRTRLEDRPRAYRVAHVVRAPLRLAERCVPQRDTTHHPLVLR